jgi:hypothetical protein
MVNLKKQTRRAGVTLTAATLALMAAEGVASATLVAPTTSPPDVVEGTVSSVATDAFTLTSDGGNVEAIATMPSTTYDETGSSVPLTGVADGEHVAVVLDPTEAAPTATKVTVLLDRLSGRVVDISGSTIRLAHRGGLRAFEVTPSTHYSEAGTAENGVTDGEYVTAFGTDNSSAAPSELVAKYVDIAPTPTPPKPVGPRQPITTPPTPRGPWPTPVGVSPAVTTPNSTAAAPSASPATAGQWGNPANRSAGGYSHDQNPQGQNSGTPSFANNPGGGHR